MVYMILAMILNFLVDYLLLLGTNSLSGFQPSYMRSVLGAGVGSLYALGCLISGFSFLNNLFWRAVSLILVSMTAFGLNGSAVRRGAVFVLLRMALGGLASASNQDNAGMLILCAVVLFLLCRISFPHSIGNEKYVNVELFHKDGKLKLIALRDTGNLLRDPVTGEQILIAGADVGRELLGLSDHQLSHPADTVLSGVIPGLRLVPYHTVGHPSGMMLALRVEKAKIGNSYISPLVAFAPDILGRGEVYRMLTGGNV